MSAAREPGTGAEGALRLELGWDGEAVRTVRVVSTRPSAVTRLLEGIEPAETLRRVSLLYAVCAEAQTAAAAAAVAAARGQDPAPSGARASELRVAGESAHEHLFHVLVGLPRAVRGVPESEAFSGARSALREARAGWGAHAAALRGVLEDRVFGMAAAEWEEAGTLEALDDWLDADRTSVAGLLRSLRDRAWPAAAVDAMPRASRDQMLREIVPALESDPSFPSRPHWRGRAFETGALARALAAPAVAAARIGGRNTLFSRLLARLVELARLPSAIERLGQGEGASGTIGFFQVRPGTGLGWVECARGLLVHLIQIKSGLVARHIVVAPTEWNFHPRGAFAVGLEGTRVRDRGELERRARVLAASLDPCVSWGVEVRHA